MSEIKDLKKEHKKLKAFTKNTTKKRLNDRTSDSWINLRELKKLKLSVKDKIKIGKGKKVKRFRRKKNKR